MSLNTPFTNFRVWIMYGFMLAIGSSVMAQPYSERSVDINPSFSTEMMFNFNDYYMGLGGGIYDSGFEWGARVNLDFRPFYKRVKTEPVDQVSYIYREKRLFLSLDLEKGFYPFEAGSTKLGAYVGGRGGLIFGGYRGTSEKPDGKLVLSPAVGLSAWIDEIVIIKLGLNYFDDGLASVPDEKIVLNFTFVFP